MNCRPVLLVEDSQDDEELAVISLRQSGVEGPIDVARDGEEALEYLSTPRADGMPALVLLDLKLPKLSGFEILARIRSDPLTRLIPVVILSSSDLREDIVRAYELGANSYVRKPVEFASYVDVMRRVGGYWLDLNEGT